MSEKNEKKTVRAAHDDKKVAKAGSGAVLPDAASSTPEDEGQPKAGETESPTTSLSKADLFYVEKNAKSKSDEELASDLGKDVGLVREPAAKARAKPVSFFQEGKGAVAMTMAQSKSDDDKPTGRNEEFYKGLRNCIHVIDKDKPVT